MGRSRREPIVLHQCFDPVPAPGAGIVPGEERGQPPGGPLTGKRRHIGEAVGGDKVRQQDDQAGGRHDGDQETEGETRAQTTARHQNGAF